MSAVNAHTVTVNPRRVSFGKIVELGRATIERPQSFEQVRANDMQVDHRYQRPVSPAHVASIAKDFDPNLFGVIVLSKRDDGTYWVLDGQQRMSAVLKLGYGNEPLPCEVLTGLSWAEEARIYDLRNKNRKALTPQDKFKGALASGDQDALAIVRTARDAGFHVNTDDSERRGGKVPAVASLTKCRKQHGLGRLSEALCLVRDTWGTEVGPRGSFLEGLCYFLHLYREYGVQRRFVATLCKVTMTQIDAEAKDYRRAVGATSQTCYAATLWRHYNSKLREENRLPSVEEMRIRNSMDGGNRGK